jgi:hypothetical protein
MHLKKQDYLKYMQVEEDPAGKNPWMGFKPRTSIGLEIQHATPVSR